MKSLLCVVMLVCVLGVAQGRCQYSQIGNGTGAGGYNTIGGWTGDSLAALPTNWVNTLEWQGTITNVANFPSSWTCGTTTYGPYTVNTPPTATPITSLQAAVNNAETCRTNTGNGVQITIPHGMYFSGGAGLSLPQTTGDTSTNFIVLQSDTPLPTGRTVCSHGIQDNLPESTQPGIRNLGCNATNLSYQLGQTITSIPSGPFTLANGTATNTSAYNDIASMYTIECTNVNTNCLLTGAWDANNQGPHHFAIFNAEIRPISTQSSTNAPISLGNTNLTEYQQSQFPAHIHFGYDYIHGDWSDATISGGVATSAPMGHNVLPNLIAGNGCVYCSYSYSYADRALRPGGEGHIWNAQMAVQMKIVHNWFEGQSSASMCAGYSTTRWTTGYLSTSGTTATWVSGGQFASLTSATPPGISSTWNGTPVIINGTTYTISTVASMTSMTLTATMPTLTNVPYSWGPVGMYVCEDVEERGNRYTYPYSWMVAFNSGFLPNSSYQTSGSSTGSGAIMHLQAVKGGAINTVSVQAGGQNYALNDVLTLGAQYDPGAANGNVIVTGLGSGNSVSSVTVVSGTGYSVANGLALSGGSGTGATVNITSVSPTGGITGVSLGNAGTGYAASNNLTVVQSGASGGLLSVTTVTSGAINGLVVAAGTSYTLDSYVRKNGHETKAAHRYLFDGNIVENIDGSGGQNGTVMSAKANNASGGTIGNNYWIINEENTYTNNIFRNGCNGPNWGFRSSLGGGNGGGTVFGPQDMNFTNNLMYNVGALNVGCNLPSQGVTTTPQYGFRYGTNPTNQWTVAPLAAVFDSTGTTVTMQLTQQPGGAVSDQRLGDPVPLVCPGTSDAAFSVSKLAMGPPALTGTIPNGLTIVYQPPNHGTANQANQAACTFTQIQGYARNAYFGHNSDFLNPTSPTSDPNNSFGDGASGYYPLSINANFVNSIFVDGGFNVGYGGWSEGTQTAQRAYDSTTLTLSYAVFPGRNAGAYTEYIKGVAQAGNPHLWFPTNPHCVGNDPTAESCVGVVALMGQQFIPSNIAPADWHTLRLCHLGDQLCNGKASTYAAGGANQANDGEDMGANLSVIEAAQTANQYCNPTCSIGSYPDH